MAVELAAALVAGPCRGRSQDVVDALCAQTARPAMEIVIVDLAPESTPRLNAAPAAAVTYLSRPGLDRWGIARREAVRAARAPVVAFIEDHCFPAPDWAGHLIEAHHGPWAAVGYAFTNANPQTYLSRAALLARYGMFVHPVPGGASRYLSGNNISYKRDVLLALEPALAELLDIDFNLHEELTRRGLPLCVEARALAAHQNYTSLSGECRAGRPYCRLLAARRARVGNWAVPRRIFYGLACLPAAPALRLARLARSLDGRGLWPAFFSALPAIAAMYVSDALGESMGYLFGAGNAERAVLRYELETERLPA